MLTERRWPRILQFVCYEVFLVSWLAAGILILVSLWSEEQRMETRYLIVYSLLMTAVWALLVMAATRILLDTKEG